MDCGQFIAEKVPAEIIEKTSYPTIIGPKNNLNFQYPHSGYTANIVSGTMTKLTLMILIKEHFEKNNHQ
jgi:hypothetical protein